MAPNWEKIATTTWDGWPASVVAEVKASFSRLLAVGPTASGLRPAEARAFSDIRERQDRYLKTLL